MKFDWNAAWESILPICIFAGGMFVLFLIISAMCWIEDHTGIPVPLMVVLLICAARFVLSGLGVF